MSRTRHWLLGAVIAALCSFAYAKVPAGFHGGGGSGGYSHAVPSYGVRGDARSAGRYYGAAGVRPSHNQPADRTLRTSRNGASFIAGNSAAGFADYSAGVHRVAGPNAYPSDGRGGMQYAGAITPVSAESRSVPRPPVNAPVRSGSIRADVARYNEERGSSRAMQRQSDDPRQPEGSPYRN